MSKRKSSLLAGVIMATTVAGVSDAQPPDNLETIDPSVKQVRDAIILAQRTDPAQQAERDPSTVTTPLRDAVTVPLNVRLVGDPDMMVSPAAAQLIENLANDASFPFPDDFSLWGEFCLLCSARPALDHEELIQHGRTVVVQ